MKRLFPVLVLCTALFAQDKPSHNRFVPKDAQLVVRFGAPAQWQQKLGGTRLSRLVHGKTLGSIVDQAMQGFDEGMEQLKKEGKVAPELLDGLFHNYAGDIVVAIRVDMADVASSMVEGRPPHFGLVTSMSSDGKYDLAGLASALQKSIEEKDSKLRDLTVGDLKLRVAANEMQVSVPQMIDGQLVWAMADDLELAAPKLLATTDRAEHDLPSGPLAVHLQFGALLSGFFDALKDQIEGDPSLTFSPVELLQEMGLMSIENLDLQLGADGEHAVATLEAGMKPDHRGMFNALLGSGGAPKLLRFVPADCDAFSTSTFDLGELYTVFGKVMGMIGDQLPVSLEEIEKSFAEATKVRLKEDLIAHLGKEMLMLGSAGSQLDAAGGKDGEDEQPNPMAMFGGSCFVFSLADGKAFGESLETALRSRGLHAARKTEEYQGTKLHRLSLAAAVELEYAVTDDLLLLALGKDEGPHTHLRAVLDAKKAGATAPPESVTKRLRGLPEGFSGVGVSPVADTMLNLVAFARKMAAGAPIPEETMAGFEMLSGLATEMKEAGVGTMVSATYVTKSGMRSVLRW